MNLKVMIWFLFLLKRFSCVSTSFSLSLSHVTMSLDHADPKTEKSQRCLFSAKIESFTTPSLLAKSLCLSYLIDVQLFRLILSPYLILFNSIQFNPICSCASAGYRSGCSSGQGPVRPSLTPRRLKSWRLLSPLDTHPNNGLQTIDSRNWFKK